MQITNINKVKTLVTAGLLSVFGIIVISVIIGSISKDSNTSDGLIQNLNTKNGSYGNSQAGLLNEEKYLSKNKKLYLDYLTSRLISESLTKKKELINSLIFDKSDKTSLLEFEKEVSGLGDDLNYQITVVYLDKLERSGEVKFSLQNSTKKIFRSFVFGQDAENVWRVYRYQKIEPSRVQVQ